jgi:hypothetical protein
MGRQPPDSVRDGWAEPVEPDALGSGETRLGVAAAACPHLTWWDLTRPQTIRVGFVSAEERAARAQAQPLPAPKHVYATDQSGQS